MSTPSMIPIPFVGRIHFAHHLKGVLMMGFLVWYWTYNTQMVTWIILWPNYLENKISIGFIAIYWLIAANCILCLFKASTLHPGRIPAQDSSTLEAQDWTYCDKCCVRRPPRAHHCKRCQHCVRRMDHHCPWINNCVGDDNHYAFVQMCGYAFLLSLLSGVLVVMHFYVYLPCKLCDQTFVLIEHSAAIMISVLLLAVLMAFFMFCMLVTQHFNFITDRTTLQNVIEPAHIAVEFVQKSCVEVYADRFGSGPWYKWLSPCYRRPQTHSSINRIDV